MSMQNIKSIFYSSEIPSELESFRGEIFTSFSHAMRFHKSMMRYGLELSTMAATIFDGVIREFLEINKALSAIENTQFTFQRRQFTECRVVCSNGKYDDGIPERRIEKSTKRIQTAERSDDINRHGCCTQSLSRFCGGAKMRYLNYCERVEIGDLSVEMATAYEQHSD